LWSLLPWIMDVTTMDLTRWPELTRAVHKLHTWDAGDTCYSWWVAEVPPLWVIQKLLECIFELSWQIRNAFEHAERNNIDVKVVEKLFSNWSILHFVVITVFFTLIGLTALVYFARHLHKMLGKKVTHRTPTLQGMGWSWEREGAASLWYMTWCYDSCQLVHKVRSL